MQTCVELRQQRAGIIAQMRALHEAAEAEGRDLTPEEAGKWDAWKGEAESLRQRVERGEQLEAEQAAALASTGVKAGKPQPEAQDEERAEAPTMNDLIRAATGR